MTCPACGHDATRVVKSEVVIRTPLEVPSQNSVGGNHGSHAEKARYRKLRDVFVIEFTAYKRIWNIPDADGHRRVWFTRHFNKHQQLRDQANFVGGMKAVVDALTITKLIVDDKPELFEGIYVQQRSLVRMIEIVVQELA